MGSSNYTGNLEIIKNLLPGLPVPQCPMPFIPAKDGFPTLKLGGRFIHSTVSPRQEAARLLKNYRFNKKKLFFFTGDLQYSSELLITGHQEYFSADSFENSFFCFFFHDLNLFSTLLFCRDLFFLRAVLSRCFFFVNGLNDFHADQLPVPAGTSVEIMKNLPVYTDGRDYYDQALNDFFSLQSEKLSGDMTRFFFEKKWLINSSANLAYAAVSPALEIFNNKIPGGACIIAAAGPSLYKSLPLIREFYDHKSAAVMCCDTALKPLLLNGIKPHFIAALDAGFFNSRDFDIIPPQESFVCADIITHPSLFRRCRGPVLFFESGDPAGEKSAAGKLYSYCSPEKPLPRLPAGGSVIHTALEIALKLGFTKIIFTGLDFSSPFLVSHCVSTAHFDYYYTRADRLHNIETQDFSAIQPSLRSVFCNNSGSISYREYKLEQYAACLEQQTAENRIIFSNCSAWGRPLKNIHYSDCRELIRQKDQYRQENIFCMKALAALKEIYTREKNHTLEKRQDCIGRMEDVSRKLGNIKTGACDLLLHLENKKDNLPEEEKTLKKNILCLPFLSNILNLLAEPYDTRQSTESAGMKLYVFYNEIFKLSSRLQNEIIKALALL